MRRGGSILSITLLIDFDIEVINLKPVARPVFLVYTLVPVKKSGCFINDVRAGFYVIQDKCSLEVSR